MLVRLPDGSWELVVMAKPLVTVRLKVCVAECDAASATCTLKVKVPALEDVPEISPVTGLSARPGGSEPADTVHRYGDTPPAALRVCKYGELTAPVGN